METTRNQIRHPGKVVKATSRELHVRIVSMSACASCHAKGVCTASDMQDKLVDVKNTYGDRYKPGDEVVLVLKRTKGRSAVFLGYILPFLILLTALIAFTFVFDSEGLAGLLALSFLAPYYLILYNYRHKLKERFDFKIAQ